MPGDTSAASTVWTCPDCRREFGAVGRNHTCEPGLTTAEFLAEAPDFAAPVFAAVRDHLVAVDRGRALIVDPLSMKVLFKNGPTFCILDVKKKWVAVGFTLRRRLESARLSRKVMEYGKNFHHVVNVVDADQIDDEFRAWLAEAYGDEAAEVARPGWDPMVPDDVDVEIAPPPR